MPGGAITNDAGGLLLREVEKRTGVLAQFAACFREHRDPERIEPTLKELVAPRVYALALGYEDGNDHDPLRHDPWRAGRAGTEWARAPGATLRRKRLKIGALIRVTGRQLWVSLAGGYPYAERWARIWRRLQLLPWKG